MEVVAFAIAIAVAYQAMKGYRLSKERTLLYLNLSFLLLGAGLVVDALSNGVALFFGLRRGVVALAALGYTLNFIAQVLAYGILMIAYIRQTRTITAQVSLAAVPLIFFEYNAFAELILIFLVAYITVQTAINYSVSKTTDALLVFGAFLCLTFSHLFFLLFVFVPIFFPFAHVAQLLGFLLLFGMLLRVSRPR